MTTRVRFDHRTGYPVDTWSVTTDEPAVVTAGSVTVTVPDHMVREELSLSGNPRIWASPEVFAAARAAREEAL